jgi:streptogrisin D
VIRKHPRAAPGLAIGGIGPTGPVSRRAMAAIALTGMLVSALVVPSTAQAAAVAPTDGSDVSVTAVISMEDADVLAGALGESRTGGVYLNPNGQTVVAVTDEAAAQSVRAAGGIPHLVKYSTATLKSMHTELDGLDPIPGSSWGVDPSTNQVSVDLDSAVSAATIARLKAVTDKFGDAVRIERISGRIQKHTASTGGEMISTQIGGSLKPECSLGFNVTNASGDKYFITAGHCTNDYETWNQTWSGEYLGNRVRSSFPGNDYGIVKYNHTTVIPYGTVHHDEQQIMWSRYAVDGEPVSRAGGVSNDMIGMVLEPNTTVTYNDGTQVFNVIKTSNCSKFGDSGGALYNGYAALGILSGGNTGDGVCNDNVSDKRSWYQPVQEVLDTYNLSVY